VHKNAANKVRVVRTENGGKAETKVTHIEGRMSQQSAVIVDIIFISFNVIFISQSNTVMIKIVHPSPQLAKYNRMLQLIDFPT
jgi:hypothetical protein